MNARLLAPHPVCVVVLVVGLLWTSGGAFSEETTTAGRSLYRRRIAFRVEEVLATTTLEDPFPIGQTLRILTNEVPLAEGTDYTYDPVSREIIFTPPLPVGTEVEITYESLPLTIPRRFTLDIFSGSRATAGAASSPFRTPGRASPLRQREPNPPFRDVGLLNVSGSKTFGISAGNRRSFSPDQSLQLSLDGEILPGITVSADLTDQQLPFQPEGTTEELNRLDQVLIRIEGSNFAASLGEDRAALEGTTLLLTPRPIQGVQGSADFGFGEAQFIVALPKGAPESVTIVGVEGQNEYRVRANGRFVAMVAGSERVWLNGVEMRRGEANDYVIRDYGDPIVEFTPKHLITSNDIIRIDFEYRPEDEGWQRNLYAGRGGLRWADGKVSLGLAYATEADNRARPLGLLSSSEIALLKRGLTTRPTGEAIVAPIRREIFGLDSHLRWSDATRLDAEWAFHRLDENTYSNAEPLRETVAWRVAATSEGEWYALDAQAQQIGAGFQPIGTTGMGRRRNDYGTRFDEEGFGDALLGTGLAAVTRDAPSTDRNADVRVRLMPLSGLSASGTFGLSGSDFATDALNSERRNLGGEIVFDRAKWPTLRRRRRESRVKTGGHEDFRKLEEMTTLGYRWHGLEAEATQRRFLAVDENIADGLNRNRRQRMDTLRLGTTFGTALTASLRIEREANAEREPILATAEIPIGFGDWVEVRRARTASAELTYRPSRWIDLRGTVARRALESLRESSPNNLTTNLADLEANLSPFRDALQLRARYALDRRLTSRREEIFTNVILVDGVPVTLKPGQGTHVKVDDLHYVEDAEVGDYIRIVRTVGDTPVTAVEGRFGLRIEPSRALTQRRAPTPPRDETTRFGWKDVLSAVTFDADWNLTEEQEAASVGQLLRLQDLRSKRTVFGRLLTSYRLILTPIRTLSVDLDWTRRNLLNRRLNSQSRRDDGTTRRLAVRWNPVARWTFEWKQERRRTAERVEAVPVGGETPVPPALLSQIDRVEWERSLEARYQWLQQLTIGLRLLVETEDSEETTSDVRQGNTRTRAAETLFRWRFLGKGNADILYRLAEGRSAGELSSLTQFRFYEGWSHEVRVNASYRMRSFTDLTFTLSYRMLAVPERPTEHRADLRLIAEL